MSKIEERIAQLLRLAEDQAGTPEGELAAAQAERLMVKHAIDRANLDTGAKTDKITTRQFHFGGAYNVARGELAANVAAAMGLRSYYAVPGRVTDYVSGKTTGVGQIVTVVGFESDLDEAYALIASLDLQAAAAMKVWYKTAQTRLAGLRSQDKENHRRAFIESFGRGARKRIEMLRASVISETMASEPGTAVVMVDRTKAIGDWLTENLDLRKSSRRGLSNAEGYAAGQNANVGQTSIGGGARSIEA